MSTMDTQLRDLPHLDYGVPRDPDGDGLHGYEE